MPILQERQDKNTIKVFMKHSISCGNKKINVFSIFNTDLFLCSVYSFILCNRTRCEISSNFTNFLFTAGFCLNKIRGSPYSFRSRSNLYIIRLQFKINFRLRSFNLHGWFSISFVSYSLLLINSYQFFILINF